MSHVTAQASRGSSPGAYDDLSRAGEVADRLGRILAAHRADEPRMAHLRQLRDELSSHILAARVLIDAGASPVAIAQLVGRASAVIDEAEALAAAA